MKIKSINVINGKNKWSESKDKLIHMILDLGEFEEKPSDKIEGFYERIKEYLPSLKSHRCSEGKPGGFFKRIKDGTWMGHIIEHVALELQTLAGMNTGWGRTRGVKGQKGVYNVVFNYEDKDSGKLAAREAFNVVNDIIDNKNPQIDRIVKKLKPKNLKESIRRILREEVTEDKNLYGEKLRVCSTKPMTGFYRDGYCKTGDDDTGSHTVCARVTEEFLEFTNSMGNNLDMLEPGDKWCLCAKRWEEANKKGVAPEMIKRSTNIKTLDIIDSDEQELDEYARTLKNARRQGVGLRFPKSAVKANPQRFRKYTRDNIKESVAPQVRRRHGEFDRIFKSYRDSFKDHPYKTFESFWNLLMESSLETLYFAWFSKTISDDDWEESAEYIENYLIEKYYDDTKKMWEKKHRKKINESEDNKEKNIQKNLRVIKELINMVDYSEICDMWVEYNNEDGYYEIKSKIATKNHNTKSLEKEFRFLESSLKDLKLKSHVFHPHWVEECEDENKLNESEETNSILHNLINMLFDGFDGTDYDWANYMCGMGECCDPYAIGFVLPKNNYDDYIFKLVDSVNYDDDGDYPKELRDELPEVCYESPDIKNPDFDTIVFYGLYAEEIEDYMGPESNWRSDLLNIINKKFGCEAKQIIII